MNIPATAMTLAIDVSPSDSRIVIFDRTGLADDDGEWGDEIAAFNGDIAETATALEDAGFTVTWHSNYNFGNEAGELYTATRATN